MPEEKPPVAAAIPTPEELGVTQPKKAPARTVDWPATQQRLQRLGVVSFQMQPVAGGTHRFKCWLSAASGGDEIQADGASEAEAVAAGLARLDRLRTASRATARH
jgi:hypothetical protein